MVCKRGEVCWRGSMEEGSRAWGPGRCQEPRKRLIGDDRDCTAPGADRGEGTVEEMRHAAEDLDEAADVAGSRRRWEVLLAACARGSRGGQGEGVEI